nr:hypothetical protein [uncultured Chryseobacterium sp.]
MDKLDLYKNKAKEKTAEYIDLYKTTYKPDANMSWHLYSDFMGENLLKELKEMHSFYVNRIESDYKKLKVEDFCMPYIDEYQTACRAHIQNVQGL